MNMKNLFSVFFFISDVNYELFWILKKKYGRRNTILSIFKPEVISEVDDAM